MLVTNNLTTRLSELRETAAWQNYVYARERVIAMKELEAERLVGSGAPSDYWAEELAGFEYLLDASPLIVDKLRHHSYHVTGLKVYDYRTHKDKYESQLRSKRQALIDVAGGTELLVPEPRALGGFGFEFDGEVYNLDTLKYFEALLALDRGAILNELRTTTQRKAVWEIGAGWGGLAYQFKTVCPNVTYIISDFPELYLFSAVYLMTVMPEARVRFYGEVQPGDEMTDWESYDFIFLPHTRLDAVAPERLDLTLNTVSFQEMTTGQVEAYVERAHELHCPYLYSLNRERSLYNPDLLGVRTLIERYYWTHEIEVLPVSYVHMLDRVEDISRAKRAKLRAKWLTQGTLTPKNDLDYKHIVGWRRAIT